MTDFFLSYNGADVAKAEWIAWTLRDAGYSVRFAQWEIGAGYDIAQWMTAALEDSNAMVCVASPDYLKPAAKYSAVERAAMLWRDIDGQAGGLIFIKVKPCDLPKIFATRSYVSLTGKSRDEARKLVLNAVKRPSAPTSEPDFQPEPAAPKPPATAPGAPAAGVPKKEPAFEAEAAKPAGKRVSNIPVQVPQHFLGRKDDLGAIAKAFTRQKKKLAVTVLHGLRGVGKTTLAAAYAERNRDDYRVTWWIRAQTSEGMRADLVGLGAQLGWVPADAPEEPALPLVLERLSETGDGILLIYDNAVDPDALRPFLPKTGKAHILVTSNYHAWRGRAEPVEIRHWPKQTGADYLVVRTGRGDERDAAEKLSEALGGLPLAHEQAAAYCERLSVSPSQYLKRFETEPARLLDDARHAPADYHDGTTVAKTFAIAIEQAAKLHPAAEPLLRHAAILPPDPVPLFLFSEGREHLGEPLKSALAGDGLDEALAALAAFALVEREAVPDERDATIATECFRLHRLVRQVATGRAQDGPIAAALAHALKSVTIAYSDAANWPRWRRLDSHAFALATRPDAPEYDKEAGLLDRLSSYRHNALAAYAEAQALYEKALAWVEQAFGPEHINTAISLNNLAFAMRATGDLERARELQERSLKITEAVEGPGHLRTAVSLANLGAILVSQGKPDTARPLLERALSIAERAFEPDDIRIANYLNNLGDLLLDLGEFDAAQPLLERSLALREKARGPNHSETAQALNNLGSLLLQRDRYDQAEALLRRGLAIHQRTVGDTHPLTTATFENLAVLKLRTGHPEEALELARSSLAARESTSGPGHAAALPVARFIVRVLGELGRGAEEAAAIRARYGLDS